MNRVILIGNMASDPEVLEAKNGTHYIRYAIAVQRRYPSKSGAKVDFINCQSFGKTADVIGKYFFKGSKICCEGEWHVDKYTKDNGQKMVYNICNVSTVEFCESKNSQQNGLPPMPETEQAFEPVPERMASLPFN